ncbi:MAG: sterol desaturase family protein [Microthrixaceae bacterium]
MADLTVAALPYYQAGMALEGWWNSRQESRRGPVPGDYEWRDTLASLGMGTLSLLAPFVTAPLVRRLDAKGGRWGRLLIGAAAVAAGATLAADAAVRVAEHRRDGVRPGEVPDGPPAPEPVGADTPRARWGRRLRRAAGSAAVTTVASATFATTATWAAHTTATKLFRRRVLPDLGNGPLAWTVAMVGWDFIYYLNHRLMHTTRFMWAIHVVHHSSERYNLSTALRQPVADPLGLFVPYGVLSLLGVRPEIIQHSRAINLMYQFWIHTEAIDRIGPFEKWFNSPSHHRVHHGSNRRYIDRNHGGILIVWDRLLGTFEPEDPEEPVVYGLTKNLDSFSPLVIGTHEYADIARDVAGADNWADRLQFVFRGPGWAYERHRRVADEQLDATDVTVPEPVGV